MSTHGGVYTKSKPVKFIDAVFSDAASSISGSNLGYMYPHLQWVD